jgi:hypothetical protein
MIKIFTENKNQKENGSLVHALLLFSADGRIVEIEGPFSLGYPNPAHNVRIEELLTGAYPRLNCGQDKQNNQIAIRGLRLPKPHRYGYLKQCNRSSSKYTMNIFTTLPKPFPKPAGI